MQAQSEFEIKRFTEYRANYESGKWKGYLSLDERLQCYRERLSGYVCSLVLGRDFLESCDVFFERKGLTDFIRWADMEAYKLFKAREDSELVREA